MREGGGTFSTAYLKWYSKNRDYLIPTIRYAMCPRERDAFWAPKIGNQLESAILKKCISIHTKMKNFLSRSDNTVYYRTTGGLYWKVFTDFAPAFYVNDAPDSSSLEARFTLANEKFVKSAVAVLSSDVFWWWYTITSNLRDLNPAYWKEFPVPESAMNDPQLQQLGIDYITDLKKNSRMRIRNQKPTGKTETQHFKVSKSKPIIDRIDRCLAPHYGFDDGEIDFIINYDIKYRMRWGEASPEDDA